ncbi:hypothetical protein DEDE109153_08905 [Deinococcus deserti]
MFNVTVLTQAACLGRDVIGHAALFTAAGELGSLSNSGVLFKQHGKAGDGFFSQLQKGLKSLLVEGQRLEVLRPQVRPDSALDGATEAHRMSCSSICCTAYPGVLKALGVVWQAVIRRVKVVSKAVRRIMLTPLT